MTLLPLVLFTDDVSISIKVLLQDFSMSSLSTHSWQFMLSASASEFCDTFWNSVLVRVCPEKSDK